MLIHSMWKLRVAGIIWCALAVFWPVTPAQAADGSIYLTPVNMAVVPSGTVTVQVRTQSTMAIAAVQANFTYDAALIDYVSTSFDGGAYEFGVESSGANGVVRMARATFNPSAGDKLVATVSFKAKAPLGTVPLLFTSETEMTDGYTSITATQGATLVISGTATVPTPTPTIQPKPNTSRSTVLHTPTPQSQDGAPPEIMNQTVDEITYNNATLHFKTSEVATGVIRLGVDENYGNEIVFTPNESHSIGLASVDLQPSTTYHYQIVAKDGAGNEAITKDATFTTLGVLAVFSVKDTLGKPLLGSFVTVDGVTKQVDGAGRVYFEVAAGLVKARVLFNEQQYEYTLLVAAPAADGNVETHELPVDTFASKTWKHWFGVGAGAAAMASVVYAAVRLLHSYKFAK